MKKISILLVAIAACIGAMAQKPVIEFKEKSHDFGQVLEENGPVSTVFEFTNTGSEPLVLSNVKASCGCTATNWTKSPVEPGQKGTVTARYNVNGRPGKFTKTITVTSNATEPSVRLSITGEVIPKAAKPVDKYPFRIGEVGLAQRAVMMGEVKKGESKTMSIEMANNSKQNITASIFSNNQAIMTETQPVVIEPGKTGSVYIKFNSADTKVWGPIDEDLYVVINGKKTIDLAHKLEFRVNVVEDFSKMTTAQKQNAPIAKFAETTINLGTLKAGANKEYKLNINNQGASNPLYIRRILSNTNEVKATPKGTSIKSGKSSYITISVNTTGLAPQAYKRAITVITNDPDHPKQVISINWTVE